MGGWLGMEVLEDARRRTPWCGITVRRPSVPVYRHWDEEGHGGGRGRTAGQRRSIPPARSEEGERWEGHSVRPIVHWAGLSAVRGHSLPDWLRRGPLARQDGSAGNECSDTKPVHAHSGQEKRTKKGGRRGGGKGGLVWRRKKKSWRQRMRMRFCCGTNGRREPLVTEVNGKAMANRSVRWGEKRRTIRP
jgi:hypothetical protein